MTGEISGINIDKELLKRFKIYCIENGTSMKKKVEELIKKEMSKK